MVERPPHTSLLVLNHGKKKPELSLNKTCLAPDEAIKQSYYAHNKTLPENSLKHFQVHDMSKQFAKCSIGCKLEVRKISSTLYIKILF